MRIHAPKGTRVVFEYPENGGQSDREFAAKHLTVGSEYTVLRTDVNMWRQTVELVEFSDLWFNTTHFKEVPNG